MTITIEITDSDFEKKKAYLFAEENHEIIQEMIQYGIPTIKDKTIQEAIKKYVYDRRNIQI